MKELCGALFLLAMPLSVEAQDMVQCRYDRSIATAEALIRASDGVYLITVTEFTNSDGSDIGTYRANVMQTLHGTERHVLTLDGRKPPDFLPQYYLDATDNHASYNSQNLNANSGQGFLPESVDGDCRIVARFLPNYTYLVFLERDHTSSLVLKVHPLSFEPINSVSRDEWYRIVREQADLINHVQ